MIVRRLAVYTTLFLMGGSITYPLWSFENKPEFADFRRIGSVVERYSTKKGAAQYGITLKLRGNAIVALADGRIASSGRLRGYGLYVIIDHGLGWHSLYSHLSRIDTATGRRVKKGASIGIAKSKKLFLVVSYRGNPINPSEVF